MSLILREGAGSGVTSVSLGAAFSPQAGAGYLAFVSIQRAAGTSNPTMSDTLGGTWNLLYAPSADTGKLKLAVYWGTGLAGGPGNVTADWGAEVQDNVDLHVWEFTGQHPTDFMGDDDTTNSGAATVTSIGVALAAEGKTLHTLAGVCVNGGFGGSATWGGPLAEVDQGAPGTLRASLASADEIDTSPDLAWVTARVAIITAVEILAATPAALRRRMTG